jgi:hypothetical protein
MPTTTECPECALESTLKGGDLTFTGTGRGRFCEQHARKTYADRHNNDRPTIDETNGTVFGSASPFNADFGIYGHFANEQQARERAEQAKADAAGERRATDEYEHRERSKDPFNDEFWNTFRNFYRDAGYGSRPPPNAPRETSPNFAWISQAFNSLPQEQHQKLYRALASVLHPDAGGSHEAFVALANEKDRRGL